MKPDKSVKEELSAAQLGDMFGVRRLVASRKYFELLRFPEEQREKVKDVLDGKEVVIEHDLRHGKIVCRFIPTPSEKIVTEDMKRQRSGTPIVIYQCGLATRDAHEKEVVKKIKAGVSPEELIDDFFKRQQIEGVTFFEPTANLAKVYFFSEELKRLLPEFLNFIVEKLDVSRICAELDEHQTLDFVPPKMAQFAGETKKILVEDFLAKHTNEQEVKRALGIKQGGARKRQGFVWTGKEKIAFYQQVESLPKRGSESYWKYALDVLIEQEFDVETLTWLKSRPGVKDFPEQLFDEAVKTWRKYLKSDNWNEMKPEEKPRAFEYRHALYLLSYPDKFKFSTLDKQFYVGKRLSDSQMKT
jgi:hypothetical protein